MKEDLSYITGNPAVLKKINVARILHQLRFNGSASRAELARRTRLDAKTLTNVSQTLLADGLIQCRETVALGRGRPAENITLNPEAAYGIGLDLGSQQVTGAVIDLAGNVQSHFRREFDIPKDGKYLLNKAEEVLHDLLGSLTRSARKRVQGIGFCVPGFLNREEGVVVESVNIRGFTDVPIIDQYQARFKIPVILEEASRTMALAELWFGKHKNSTHFICIDMGIGIGMGIIHNGILYRGSREQSGEIGHTVVEPHGQVCRCGKRGCLERVASGKALSDLSLSVDLEKYKIKCVGAKAIYQAAQAGDVKAKAILRRTGEYIGIAISNVINLFDPDLVILNGGLINAGDLLLDPLKDVIKTNCMNSKTGQVQIEISGLGNLAGAMGAAMLPLEHYFEFENIHFWPGGNR